MILNSEGSDQIKPSQVRAQLIFETLKGSKMLCSYTILLIFIYLFHSSKATYMDNIRVNVCSL